MRLFIRPADTLFFRDGRPFDAGTDNVARGIFPPYPPTLYGVMRSAILMHANVDFNAFANSTGSFPAEVGSPDKFGSLELTGPWLAERSEGEPPSYVEYFPAPLNLVRNKDQEREIHFLIPDGETRCKRLLEK